MLARSTAWRHGDGRTWAKATSMTARWPSRTSRLAGLMSRWARPASHSRRTICQALVDDGVVDLGVADLLRAVEELGDEQVLALRRELDDAHRLQRSGCRRRASAAACSPRTRRAGAPTGTAPRPRGGRRGSCARACTSGRSARGSSRRASRRGGGRSRGGEAQRRRAARPGERERLDVDDAQAELLLDGAADGLATPPADVEVGRLAPAVADRERRSLGVNQRNAISGTTTPNATATRTSKGWSMPSSRRRRSRWRRRCRR